MSTEQNDQVDRVGKFRTTTVIVANQFFILGCLTFLVLVQLGHDMKTAADLSMIIFVGGALYLLSGPIARALYPVYQWWGDRSD